MKAYKYKAQFSLSLRENLIRKGESLYISKGFREGSYAKTLVRIYRENGEYIGKFVKDRLDFHKNFKSIKDS